MTANIITNITTRTGLARALTNLIIIHHPKAEVGAENVKSVKNIKNIITTRSRMIEVTMAHGMGDITEIHVPAEMF